MAKFKCVQCGTESEFQANMMNCPNCKAEISQDDLITLTESADIAATIDTALPDSTIDAPNRLLPDDNEKPVGGSSKTVLAADAGYADIPAHLQTLERSETVNVSAGKSSAIPPRTIADDDADGELRDYKIVSEIGSGSFGTVYRAVQVPLDRNVAIKLLKPLPLPPSTEGDQSKEARQQAEWKIREEFLREAQFTGKLEHPNIVPIHDIGIVSGGKRIDRPFYVMKEIKGISWQDVFSEKTRDENVEIFNRVVDAMGFSHSRNILHCDLKPENVMLGEFGEVLVVDWGQAIDSTRPETLRPGGTPAYCSPEMAQYWCDFGANAKQAEESQRHIGPRSDVYLLGAILFQIVTGRAPHFGLKGETPVDVMRRAASNEIRRYDDFAKDELLQIALRALRVSQQEEISTVAQFQSELKSYDERKQSIDIRDRAFELLEEARISTNYDTYQKAKFGFEESLELWHQNPTAQEGLHQTRLSCAELALKDQNFDLGLGMLAESDTKEEIQVKEKLLVGKRKRDRRKRMVFILAVGFTTAVIGGLGVTTYLGKQVSDKIVVNNQLIADVEVQKVKAEGYQKEIAEFQPKMDALQTEFDGKTQQLNNEFVDKQAELNDKFAAKEMDLTEQFGLRETEFNAKELGFITKEKDFQTKEIEFQQKQAGFKTALDAEQQKVLDEQTKVLAAREASQLLRYKTKITSIEQKVNLGDFKAARKLLDAENEKSTFEWGRLNLLSHPEVTGQSLFPDEPLRKARLSGDRAKLALCFDDRIEIRDAVDLNQLIASIKDNEVESMTLSHDGNRLAIGKRGLIQIVDVATRKIMGEPMQAQSNLITDLNFSRTGDRLLSVGVPNKINRSVATEHELMIFEAAGGQWKKMTNPKFNGNPATPTQASFSADGNRIVTSSPQADLGSRFAYVLELKTTSKDKYYQWLDRFDEQSPRRILKSGFVTSIFGDESGRTVISSFVSDSDSSSAKQVVVWNVDETDDTVPISTGTNQAQDRSQAEISYPRFSPSQTAAVDDEVNYLDFDGQILLAAAGKKITYWELPDDLTRLQAAFREMFKGHGRPITFCGILNTGSKFLTIAQGSEPEILVTNTKTYRDESILLQLDDGLTDGSSPSAIAESADSGRVIVGNDHGLISINDAGSLEKPALKWEVSAWDKHIITREHLFAISRRDDVYRYNLVSGELEEILTGLSEIPSVQKADSETSNKISSIAISADSRFAVVQRNNGKQEFEIWNLAEQTRRVVAFGDKQGLEDNVELPLLSISADGQWVAGGRVRFYVWQNDGTVVGNAGVENDVKKPLSSLRFIAGTSKLAVGAKGRLRIYDIEDGLGYQSYSISGFPDFLGKPNVVDAREYDGETSVVIRRTFEEAGKKKESGLDLIRVDGKDGFESVESFPGAQQATLTQTGELLVVSLAERAVIRFDLKTKQIQLQKIVIPSRDVAGQPTDPRDIFSGVFETNSDDLVLQWTSANKQSTVSVTNQGQLSNLSVIATPTVRAVGISKNRAVSFENGKIRLWDLNFEGQPSVTPAGSIRGNFEFVQLSPDSLKAFAVSKPESKLAIVDMETGETAAEIALATSGAVTSAGWSKDGKQLAIGFADGKIAIWQGGKSEWIDARILNAPVDRLRFSGDGNSIVAVQNSASADAGVAFVLRKSQESNANWIAVKLVHSDRYSINAADISDDGNRVVTGSKRGRVTIWNAESRVGASEDKESSERELLNLHSYLSPVRSVTFGQNEASVMSFESKSPNGEGLIFPAK